MNRELAKRLRKRIREFEDRKISGSDLSREIFYVAHEVGDASEAPLRRALEGLGNKVSVLVERGLFEGVHPEILQVVDEVESELVDWGY